MFLIETSSNCFEEKKYVVEQVFSEFLGLKFKCIPNDGIDHIILHKNGRELIIKDVFFNQFLVKDWLSSETLPEFALTNFKYEDKTTDNQFDFPILYGDTGLNISENRIEMGFDIFGSIFFMLSRYEECVIKAKDVHGRFPYKESISYKVGFIERPIVDEYVSLLEHLLQILWPETCFKTHTTKINLSCDVDFLYSNRLSVFGYSKKIVANILRSKSIKSVFIALKTVFAIKELIDFHKDPINVIDYMMTICENNGLRMAFYFIPLRTKEPIDGDYDIFSETVLRIIEDILKRGHEVGYHASYGTFNDESMTIQEVQRLKKIVQNVNNFPDTVQGGRQHFLRWETGVTELNWEAAGMNYDASLGFAEIIGFRCGTSKDYRCYNVIKRKTLNLKIRPLIAMDVTLFNSKYMNLDYNQALIKMKGLVETCKKYNSNINILWHNTTYTYKWQFSFFEELFHIMMSSKQMNKKIL